MLSNLEWVQPTSSKVLFHSTQYSTKLQLSSIFTLLFVWVEKFYLSYMRRYNCHRIKSLCSGSSLNIHLHRHNFIVPSVASNSH